MTLAEIRSVVATHATLLGPRLFEATSVGISAADRRAQGLRHATYPHLRPLLTRAEMREYLDTESLPAGWTIGGTPQLMGQLYLFQPELGLSLRVLKERRRTYPGGVPIAGSNRARRRVWQMQLPLGELAPPQSTELLLLWDYIAPDVATTGFTLRIVHPVEAGVYGRPVKCDLDFAVTSGGTVFDELSFKGHPDDADFFEADIDEAENDE